MNCSGRLFRCVALGSALLLRGDLLISGAALWAQTTEAVAGAGQKAPNALFIQVLEGEGDLNDVRARTAREPIVEVDDRNHKPVAGALVLFSIQSGGGPQTASFSGLSTLTVTTGPDGRAVAQGFETTKHTGNVRIVVKATVGALVAEAIIHQTNVAKGGHQGLSAHKSALAEAALVAGFVAAVTTIVIKSQSPSTTTITAGPGSVGAARPLTGQP